MRLWAALAATLLLLAGCSAASTSGSGAGVNVVASTDVYGDLVQQVAGRLAGAGVHITSLINGADADPHSYEASARTALAISRADVIVENGGGYDDFVDTLRAAVGTHATVLNAVAISGKPVGADFNEHVWYDLHTVGKLVNRIAAALSEHDRANAVFFTTNAARLIAQLQRLEASAASIREAHGGTGVAITEPVPLYLLQACGLVNRTPTAFSEAVENGTDVALKVLHDTEQLIGADDVALLVYNDQTSSVATQQVLAAATDSGVAVVPMSETLPAHRSYVTWMQHNIAAIREALR